MPDHHTPTPATSAWVESPLQALSVVEAHAAGLLGPATTLVPRSDVALLRPTLTHLAALDLPAGLSLQSERAAPRPRRSAGERSWVVGDAFSGRVQRQLALDGSGQVVIVADGRATLHLVQLLAESAPLVRARAAASPARRLLGRLATERLRRAAREGRLTVVTAYDLAPELRAELAARGVRLHRHRFEWLRRQALPAAPEQRAVVLARL